MREGVSLMLLMMVCGALAGDMMRKSIVFDKATPDLFYCPTDKPTSFEKMYVRARPLKNLCEFKGDRLPPSYKSDCYNDVDESDWACKEKKRITMRFTAEETDANLITNLVNGIPELHLPSPNSINSL